jgi:hypothetical protein
MKPTYFMLTFSKSDAGRNQYFRVYIELRDEDKALLESILTDALKARLIVERIRLLDFLPNGLNESWPYSWTVLEHRIESFWHMGIQPTRIKERNVWIIQGG